MRVIVCDWRDDKGNPCAERADITVSFTWDGKNYEVDLCSQLHAKSLTANAREAEAQTVPAGYNKITRLPAAKTTATGRKVQEQLVDKIDYVDMRAWLEAQGDLPAGSRGRVSQTLQQKWVDAGEPRPT